MAKRSPKKEKNSSFYVIISKDRERFQKTTAVLTALNRIHQAHGLDLVYMDSRATDDFATSARYCEKKNIPVQIVRTRSDVLSNLHAQENPGNRAYLPYDPNEEILEELARGIAARNIRVEVREIYSANDKQAEVRQPY